MSYINRKYNKIKMSSTRQPHVGTQTNSVFNILSKINLHLFPSMAQLPVALRRFPFKMKETRVSADWMHPSNFDRVKASPPINIGGSSRREMQPELPSKVFDTCKN